MAISLEDQMELGSLAAEQCVREARAIDYAELRGNIKEVIDAIASRDPFDVNRPSDSGPGASG